MSKRLAVTVHVANPETGVTEVFGPHVDNGEVPDWAVEQITSPDVWADADADSGTKRRTSRRSAPADTGDE